MISDYLQNDLRHQGTGTNPIQVVIDRYECTDMLISYDRRKETNDEIHRAYASRRRIKGGDFEP